MSVLARTSSSSSSQANVDKVQQSCDSMLSMQSESSPSINSINNSPKTRIRGRRRLKSALYFAVQTAVVMCSSALLLLSPIATSAFSAATSTHRSSIYEHKHEWIERSIEYYSNVTRKKSSSSIRPLQKNTQIDYTTTSASKSPLLADVNTDIIADTHDKDFVRLATNHYYARYLIKAGKYAFAEKIYRRIINELTAESDDDDHECDHTKLAVSTLLLALHMQRTGDIKATRAVFVNFFRRVALVKEEDGEVHKCSCSAKVLQAYALFEMKNGHSAKSLEIIQRAVKMDADLSPVLEWKQFRDAAAGRVYSPTFSFRKNKATAEQKSKVKRVVAP